MITLSPNEITPAIRALFPPDQPAQLRFDGVLAGVFPGRILTDNPDQPTWAVLQEQFYGTLYLGGAFNEDMLEQIVRHVRADSAEVLFGYWDDQQPLADLFPEPLYRGAVIDFTGRTGGLADLAPFLIVPSGMTIRPFDAELLPHSADYDSLIGQFEDDEAILENGIGVALLKEDEIVSEGFAGLRVGDVIELGVSTRPAHRRKGYGSIVSAHLIKECESRGLKTYWNTNAANIPSVQIARNMGYQNERIYNLIGW